MNEYSTKDIYLATTLLALDFPLLRIDKDNKIFYFIFGNERTPHIIGDTLTPEKVVEAYWIDGVDISPKKLFTAFKEIKNRMYA